MSGPTPYSAYVPAGSSTSTLTSASFTKFTPGQVLYFSYNYKTTRVSGSTNDNLTLSIQWYDSSNTALSNPSNTLAVSGSTTGFVTKEVQFTVPANAVRGVATLTVAPSGAATTQMDVWISGLRLAPTALGATVGADLATNVTNATQDYLPNGATYGRTLSSRLSSGKPLIDFNEAIHLNKNLDNIEDGSSYARISSTRVNASRPVIDLSEGIHFNKSQDYLPDGSTYGRPLASRLNAGKPTIDFSEGIHANQSLVNNSNVPVGRNVVINSEFAYGGNNLFGWVQGGFSTATTPTWGVNLTGSPNWFGQLNVAYVTVTGTPASGAYMDSHFHFPSTSVADLQKWALPVFDGDMVFSSALVAIHRLSYAYAEIHWWDGSGAYITENAGSTGGTPGGAANGDPNQFTRLTCFHTAPSGARFATMRVRGICNGTDANPYMFYTQMMLAKIAAGQTAAPPYTPGPLHEPSADVTASVVGPAQSDVNYDNAGTTFQSANDLTYRAQNSSGTITSGLSASFKVKSGTFNGLTSASGAQTLTLSSGIATITPTSLATATAVLEVTFVLNGRTLPSLTTNITKVLAPASSGSGSGGSGTSASQNTGFGTLAANAWATQTVISNTLSFTTGASQTSVTLAIASLANHCSKTANQMGAWNVEYRWQRLISGTWTDVGTYPNSNPDLYLVYDPELAQNVVNDGSVSDSQTLGSLSANTAYSFRLTAKVTTGTVATNVAMTFPSGSISVS